MHRRLYACFVLCLLITTCGCASNPVSRPDIDPVATQMAMNTRAVLRKTAGPTLTAEAMSRSGSAAAPSELAPTEPAATASPDQSGGFGLVKPLPPQDLDSYRLLENIIWNGVDAQGVEVSEQYTTTIEFVREPPAMHMSMSTDAEEMAEAMGLVGLQGNAVELYMQEGSFYMWMFGGWMQMSLDALTMGFGFGEIPLDSGELDFASTYTMTQWIEEATYVGQETYHGQDTNHYRLDSDSFDPATLPAGMEVESIKGDLYAAVEGDYVVHLDLTLQGRNLTAPGQPDENRLAEGSLTYQSSLSAINEALTILLPGEVEEATSPPDDIPIPEGARQVTGATMFGASMFALLTEASPEEVAGFYAAGMPEFGWTEVEMEEDASEAMFSTKYAKDDRTILLEIDGDSMFGTSVMLSSGDPGQIFPVAGEP